MGRCGDLFKKIFGKYPKGKIYAESGVISLDFTIFDDEDFAVALGASKKDTRPTSGFEFISDAVKGEGIPIIGVRLAPEVKSTHLHEQEHVKNEIFAVSRGNALDDIIQQGLNPAFKKVVAKIESRQKERRLTVGDWAKDEIIAQIKGELQMPEGGALNTLIDYLAEAFLLPRGFYYKRFFRNRNKELNKNIPLAEQKYVYKKYVARGLLAFRSLLDFYQEDRQVLINILEQFPLRLWPAAARLLRMRHKKTAPFNSLEM